MEEIKFNSIFIMFKEKNVISLHFIQFKIIDFIKAKFIH